MFVTLAMLGDSAFIIRVMHVTVFMDVRVTFWLKVLLIFGVPWAPWRRREDEDNEAKIQRDPAPEGMGLASL